MSKTNLGSAELNVTDDDMKEMLADENAFQPATAPVKKTAPAKKKNVGYRIFALILAIAPIVCFCLFKIKMLVATASGYAVYGEATLLDALLALFKKNGLAEFYKTVSETISSAAASGFDAYKIFGLPVLAGNGALGKIMSLALYAMPAAMVVTLVLAVIALFSGKTAPALTRTIAFINFWVYGLYALGLVAVELYLADVTITLDIFTLAVAAVFLLVFFILSCLKTGKRAVMTLLLFLLTFAFAGAYIYGVTLCADKLSALFAVKDASFISSLTKGEFYRYAIFAVVGVSVLAAVISSIRLATKKGYTFDLVRYLFHLVLAGAVLYMVYSQDAFKAMRTWAIVAAAIALVQVIVVILVLSAKKKKVKAKKTADATVATDAVNQPSEENTQNAQTTEATEAAQPAPAANTAEESAQENTEETDEDGNAPADKEQNVEESGIYAEAVRYESYKKPEETLLAAEEISEPEAESSVSNRGYARQATSAQPVQPAQSAFAAQPAQQQTPSATADYDYYNSRNFDPFVASLNTTEREQFTELFILKYKGTTTNLPDYQVGGDNTEFFRKVFIYLGQYRDRIPDSLLAKMYQYAIRK